MHLVLIILVFIESLSAARAIKDRCIFQSKVESFNFLRKAHINPFIMEDNPNECGLGTSWNRKDTKYLVDDTWSDISNIRTSYARNKPMKQSGFFRLSLYRTRNAPPPPPPPPPCSSSPCQHGSCLNSGSSYVCTCEPGWTGTQCNIDIDECLSNPCLNSATCHDQVNSYWCDCEEDYTGTRCETDMCYPSQGADIAFILDTSSSQGSDLLKRQLQYIKEIVSTFPIGVDEFRFSLITVSDSPVLHFDLNTHLSNTSILDAIDTVYQRNGTSNLDSAISTARIQVFGNSTTNKTKYLVTLSDGMYNDHISTISEVVQTKLAGITMLSVGFGRQILHQSLVDISTDYRYVFSPTTADLTQWLSRRHAMDTCPDCSTQYSDIYIMFETSSNLVISTFYQLFGAFTTLIEKTSLGQSRTHVGFATFDLTVTEKFDFVTHYSVVDAIKSAGQTQLSQQTANYTNALHHAQNKAFVSIKGYRQGSRKILILFISDLMPNLDNVKSQADTIKADGVIVIIVTASSCTDPDLSVLQALVSDPSYLFVVGDKVYGSTKATHILSSMFDYSFCAFD